VFEVGPGDALLGLDDVLDSVGVHAQILRFGAENGFVENLRRVVEDPAEKVVNKFSGDTVAEPAGQDGAPFMREVLQLFQITFGGVIGARRKSRAPISAMWRSRGRATSGRTCRYLGFLLGLPSTRRGCAELTAYPPRAAARRVCRIGSVNFSNSTTSSTKSR